MPLRRRGAAPAASRAAAARSRRPAWRRGRTPTKLGVAVDQRRGRPRAERSAIRSMTALVARELAPGSVGAASSAATRARRCAVSSSSRWAISATEYLAASTSPCSVIFSRPATVPGGWARIATFVGPPPRPSAPPRPWKKTQRTPCAREHLGERRSARGRSPSRRRRSRRPCWSPSSRSSPPARRRPRAARRGRPAARAACRIVAGGVAQRLAGLEQRHDRAARALAAGAREARSPSSAAAPRAGRPGPRCPR